jgi:predicted transcriptional regulator
MLYPDQNRTIVQYLKQHSSRPLQALEVWAHCFEHLNSETGEIRLTRAEIATLAGISENSVSIIMSELKNRNAILSRRTKVAGMRGQGAVRYYMNPNVATHLPGKARDQAQAAAPKVARAAPKQTSLQLVISSDTKQEKSPAAHSEKSRRAKPIKAQ